MIFKLEPANLTAAEWENSTYRDAAIIRAATEQEARQCAATAFTYVRDTQPGDDPVSPWLQPELATCVPCDDPAYDAEGPAMIIAPAFFD